MTRYYDSGTAYEVCSECGNKTVLIASGFRDACGVDHNDPPISEDSTLPSRTFACPGCGGDGERWADKGYWCKTFNRPCSCNGTGFFLPRWRAGLAQPFTIPELCAQLKPSEDAYIDHLFGPSDLISSEMISETARKVAERHIDNHYTFVSAHTLAPLIVMDEKQNVTREQFDQLLNRGHSVILIDEVEPLLSPELLLSPEIRAAMLEVAEHYIDAKYTFTLGDPD